MHPTIRGTLDIVALQDIFHVNIKEFGRKKGLERPMTYLVNMIKINKIYYMISYILVKLGDPF